MEVESKRLKQVDTNTSKKDLEEEEKSFDEGRMCLVFDTVIRTLKCPVLLRTCRLVCKSWNASACAVIRQTPKILTSYQITDDEQIDMFEELGKNRELVLEDFPSPFRKIGAALEYEEDYRELQKYLSNDVILTDLELKCQITEENVQNFALPIFTWNLDTLTSLKIDRFKDFPGSHEVTTQMMEIRFRNLKKFDIPLFENCFKEQSVMKLFITNILQYSKLELLKLQVSNFDLWQDLNFQNVTSLQICLWLDCETVSENFLRYIKKNPLPNLKRLTISVSLYVYKSLLCPMISSVANSLEMLDIDGGKLYLNYIPVFPKVRELSCEEGYKGDCLAEKFPALTMLKSGRPPSINSNWIPHLGVEYLDVDIMELLLHQDNEVSREENEEICEFCQKMETYGENFPVTHKFFSRSKGKLCYMKQAIRTINNSFPNLKSMKLGETWDLRTSLAFGLDNFSQLLDCPIENLLKEICPLQDFLNLVTLNVQGVKINAAIIVQILSKIPKLKHLKIHSYEEDDITAELISENLGHLKEICIRDCRSGDSNELSRSERRLLRKFKTPVITLYCDCDECNNDHCRCRDCDKYNELDLCF